MSNLDPTGETGCIAHFPLVTDLCETVNHQQVGLHTNATVGEVQTPITGGAVQMRRRELTTPSTLVPASGDVALLRYKDYAALARKHGIDAEAATASVGADPSYGRGIAWYETMLKGVNPKLAATLRARFRRNFAVGMKLSELEPTVGRFSIAPVDGIHTITYTTLDGQRPVRGLSGELLGSTSTAVIYFTIFVDVVGIVAAMFGIVTTAAKVTNAAGVFELAARGVRHSCGERGQPSRDGDRKGGQGRFRVYKRNLPGWFDKYVSVEDYRWKLVGPCLYRALNRRANCRHDCERRGPDRGQGGPDGHRGWKAG